MLSGKIAMNLQPLERVKRICNLIKLYIFKKRRLIASNI